MFKSTYLLFALSLLYSPLTLASASSSNEQLTQCIQQANISYIDGKANLTTLDYFGTSISIDLFNQPQQRSQQLLCDALNVIKQYHQLASNFSTYDGVVNIKSINNNPVKLHHIDPKLTELLSTSIEWHQLSQGRFNIALAPVVELWRKQRNLCHQQGICAAPEQTQLNAAAQLIHIDDIKLDKQRHTISMKAGMKLDLGGIAKGWMAEKVYDSLIANHATAFLINAGGNIRHFGQHPSGRNFLTAIEDPICRKLSLSNQACPAEKAPYHEVISGQDITLVSSGNYLNFFNVGDHEYHHIIDPTTLHPKAEGISVSVVLSEQQILADVISTSLFLMPIEQARQFAEASGFIEAVWYLDEQGTKTSTQGFNQYQYNLQSFTKH